MEINSNVVFFNVVITCSLQSPPNGNISFSESINGSYPFGATASYSCITGYSLVPSPTVRTCKGDGTTVIGEFNGNEPLCQGRFI